AEAEYERVEDARLLYVAATRAEEELIVSRCVQSEDKSPWRALYPHFDEEHTTEIEFKHPAPRQKLEATAADLTRRAALLCEQRAEAARPTYTATAVRELAKRTFMGGEALEPLPLPVRADVGPRGVEWGTIVHAALEVAARGANAERIAIACKGLLQEYERPQNENGEPAELDELLRLVEGMTRSETWKRALRAGNALIEVPFSWSENEEDARTVIDGVIDLAFREQDGWVIVDYKTDAIVEPELWRQRTETYRRQVNLYADYWERLTGEEVVERVLVLTSVGHELKWGKAGPVTAQQLDLLI
ncbi:MAG: PD-(D/E)XK nuclease family protein, partial [Gemmatimonadota bacterium]